MTFEEIRTALALQIGKNLRSQLEDGDRVSVLKTIEQLDEISSMTIAAIEQSLKIRPEETKSLYRSKEFLPILHSEFGRRKTSNAKLIKEIQLGKDLQLNPKGRTKGEASFIVLSSLKILIEAYRCGKESEGQFAVNTLLSKEFDSYVRKKAKELKKLSKETVNQWAICMADLCVNNTEELLNGRILYSDTLEEVIEAGYKKAETEAFGKKEKQLRRAKEKILGGIPYENASEVDQTKFLYRKKEILNIQVSESEKRDGLVRYFKSRLRDIMHT